MSDGHVPPFLFRFFLGIAFAAAGMFPILSALDVAPFHASQINGPPWVGVAAGAIFLAGAVFLWLYDVALRAPWLGSALAFLIVAGFAALANWIAFGPGTRQCTSSFSFGMFTSNRWVAGAECRVAFGIGAMACNGLLIMIMGTGLRQAGVAGAVPAALEKIGIGLMLLGFLPLAIVWLVAKFAFASVRWCRARITGRAHPEG